jgi:hypothetical protein
LKSAPKYWEISGHESSISEAGAHWLR